MTSVISQIILQLLFQVLLCWMVINIPGVSTAFFTRSDSLSDYNGSAMSVETTALFLFSNMPYIAMSFVFMIGKPFRSVISTNVGYLINLVLISLLSIYIMVYPAKWINSALKV